MRIGEVVRGSEPLQVLEYRQPGMDLRVLRAIAEAAADRDRTARGRQETRDDLEERRFTGAILADDTDHLAPPSGKGDSSQDLATAERAGHAMDFEWVGLGARTHGSRCYVSDAMCRHGTRPLLWRQRHDRRRCASQSHAERRAIIDDLHR